MKWCPSCRRVVETVRVPFRAGADLIRCELCNRNLGEEGPQGAIWF